MEPKPIDKELLQQEEDGARAPRRKPQRVPDFPFDFNWWVGDPYIRALCRDERAGLLDVMCYSLKTPNPGVMSEEQVRIWAGYSPAEWTAHQTHFLPLFRVRPDGTWTLTVLRTVFLAQRRRVRKARAASAEANRKRWRDKAMRPVRMQSGDKSEANVARKGLRNASLDSQDSRRESTPVPSGELSRGDPRFEALPAAAADEVGSVVRMVTAGLVRGRPGT